MYMLAVSLKCANCSVKMLNVLTKYFYVNVLEIYKLLSAIIRHNIGVSVHM